MFVTATQGGRWHVREDWKLIMRPTAHAQGQHFNKYEMSTNMPQVTYARANLEVPHSQLRSPLPQNEADGIHKVGLACKVSVS